MQSTSSSLPLPSGVAARWEAGEGHPDKLVLYLKLAALEHHRARKTAFQLSGNHEEDVLMEWAKESVRDHVVECFVFDCVIRSMQDLIEAIVHTLPAWMRQLEDPIDVLRALFALDLAALPERHTLKHSGVAVPPPLTAEMPGPDVVFLHFNDAYQVEEGAKEPIGGISRCGCQRRSLIRNRN